ncbi:MAG: hypothetical protein FGO69_09390 [Methanobacterium sp.]|jgi:hypothetical protein|nr:MAG: hypothetical protein FGO69_09390 [Methanobacterium sp.]
MSKKLNTELINLYNFYKSQETPPDLMVIIKHFLLEVEGIDPDKIDTNTWRLIFHEYKRR